ncbi:transcriptional regulator, LuxR family protein [Fibrella aestuarina BUZ 2]|uniref:Transcriptional regulator, LuxR family protein n=1 Tax=Fibrella aestuarina BUZ 2 TaxID=1166018 RepID=I0K8J3_9BACT|nr:helix-turn-helix transcriptional regulator [Fibrella aestuarina]CCH00446.1 transcriptional regulator, LuxR family protein [Fibrella aestuarina BUZ 2]
MIRHVLVYGLALGSLVSLMVWSEYRLLVIGHVVELYLLLVAVVFALVGIWLGLRWSSPTYPAPPSYHPAPQPDPQVISQLGISSRELDVLVQLAQGLSNDEIADRLFVSPNTVKTHLANLYVKLDVKRRT